MEKEMFPRAYLAERYPEFAEHFMQGNILILGDRNKRIIKFTDPNTFRPELSFIKRLLNYFYLEFYTHNDDELAECIRTGADIVIDMSLHSQKWIRQSQ